MMTMVETMMATSIGVGIVILLANKIELVQRSFLDLNEKMCIIVVLFLRVCLTREECWWR